MELAQNAADAASLANVPGRLRLELADGLLVASNDGAPLSPSGVEALSTLRASAKRGPESVGRFGVGFAAVLAVTDAPEIRSAGGGVRWSRASSAAAAGQLPALREELAARGDAVPVLRLPLPAAATAGPTQVIMPLRDEAAVVLVRRLLAEVDLTLLLALPALVEVVVVQGGVERRLSAERGPSGLVTIGDGERRSSWRVTTAAGVVAPEVLAGRSVEERGRTAYMLTWALPVDVQGRPVPLPAALPRVLRAPTPTDDPLTLPAVLVAPLPTDPGRRRVAAGPWTDLLVDKAAQAYAELVADLPPSPALLSLVPVGLAGGEVDAVLRAAVLDRLRNTAWLPAAEDQVVRSRPRDTVALDLGSATGPVTEVLTGVLAGLLPTGWAGRGSASALDALGVRRSTTADLVDALAGQSRQPSWWDRLYEALVDAPDRDALSALPVPLADGRTVSGARGLLVGPAEAAGLRLDGAAMAAIGLRVVHPEAVASAGARLLLARLGAVEADPRTLLEDPRVLATVAASYDESNPRPVADGVLALVAAAGLRPGELPALADLALPGEDGELYPAGELLLPGGELAGLVRADAPYGVVAGELVDQWGPETLTAVGVLRLPAVLREGDVVIDSAAAGHDLDGEAEWLDAVLDEIELAEPDEPGATPPVLTELVAVRDLEQIRPDAWPQAMVLLAALPLRAALTEPAIVLLPNRRTVSVTTYTRWWLSQHPVLGGRVPGQLRVPGAEAVLAGLYDAADASHDPELLRLLGCRVTLSDVLSTPAGALDLLDRLADPARTVPREGLRELYAELPSAFAGADLAGLAWPERLRAVRAGRIEVVDVDDVVVVDSPDLLPLLGTRAQLPVPLDCGESLAWALGVELASEVSAYAVRSEPIQTMAWADVPGVGLAMQRLGLVVAPTAVVDVHRGLQCDDIDGHPRPVGWRQLGGTDAVDEGAGAAALGRALAWRVGRWERRAAAVEALQATDLTALSAEDDLDRGESSGRHQHTESLE